MGKHVKTQLDRMDRFERRCREQRAPLTVQRRTIFGALAAREDHPTADQIYEDVRERLPGLSRTTVYRVLEAMTRLGVAQAICHPGASARYDAHMEDHDHVICVRCGRVRDLAESVVTQLPLPRDPQGFRIAGGSIYFRGVCPECQGRVPPETTVKQGGQR